MILSMTGYGANTLALKDIDIKCEILCLNKKNLEIHLNLPKFASEFELDLRKQIKTKLIRGKVNVNFEIKFAKTHKSIKLNEPLFKEWMQVFKKLSKNPDVQGPVAIADLISMPEIWQKDDKKVSVKTIKTALEKSLSSATLALTQMRKKEGSHLQKDILIRINKITTILNKINKKAPTQLKEYEKKLKSKISQNTAFSKTETDLFNRFVSAFSSKTDITEEIIRLKSHILQFKNFLTTNKAIGRSLDFLLQEFLREANTINSKSSNITISQDILEIKTLIEQIREQIQNIL